jgi:DNA polymerase bacteriophage-type
MHPADLPAGTAIGSAIVLPDGDYETYSEAGYVWTPDAGRGGLGKWEALDGAPSGNNRYGLGCVGAASYTEHPSAEVLSFYYNLKNGAGRQFWRPGLPNPTPLFDHVAAGGLFEAWNVAFERWVWLNICHTKYGWPPPPPVWQLRCAMGKARAFGLPGALAKAGEVLQLTVQKDKDGNRLLDKFSKPRNPTKGDGRTRIRPEDDPQDAVRLYQYNEVDIISEAEASARVPDLEGEELQFWQCDFAMNARGIRVDVASVENCIAILKQAEAKYNAELRQLTGGIVASEVKQLLGWLHGKGLHLDNLQEETVDARVKALRKLIEDDGTRHWDVRPVLRALEIRQAIGSASVKKVYSMRNQATRAGRLHDLFSYHAARTGRVTGNGPQPTNLPTKGPAVTRCLCKRHYAMKLRACPWCGFPKAPDARAVEWCIEAVEDALEIIATRSLEALEMYFVDALATISGCLRGLFIADDDSDLMASDFNSIEAVVLAMIANEQWRIDVFRTHGKIYEMGASKITGIPFEEYLAYKDRTGSHHPTRQNQGKVGELASGYGGWIGAWERFGAKEFGMTEDEIKAAVLAWRAASPAIVWLWGGQYRDTHAGLVPQRFGCEGMAINAVSNPGVSYGVHREDGTHTGVSFIVQDDILTMTLPSGRPIRYHRPRLERSDRYRTDWALSYEGFNTNPQAGPLGWVRLYIYGGKWVENICQATARDVLRYSIINLERAGYPVVMQVYDEIVAEIRKGRGTLEEFERIMATMPPWAAGWPIRASGGWRGRRYRKG